MCVYIYRRMSIRLVWRRGQGGVVLVFKYTHLFFQNVTCWPFQSILFLFLSLSLFSAPSIRFFVCLNSKNLTSVNRMMVTRSKPVPHESHTSAREQGGNHYYRFTADLSAVVFALAQVTSHHQIVRQDDRS